jgi:hypothetical protein
MRLSQKVMDLILLVYLPCCLIGSVAHLVRRFAESDCQCCRWQIMQPAAPGKKAY